LILADYITVGYVMQVLLWFFFYGVKATEIVAGLTELILCQKL